MFSFSVIFLKGWGGEDFCDFLFAFQGRNYFKTDELPSMGPRMQLNKDKTCHRDMIACLTVPCLSHKKL